MRRKTFIDDLEDIKRLLLYLYQEEGHQVTVPGYFPGTAFRFRMTEEGVVECAFKPNLGTGQEDFGDFQVDEISILKLITIIANLKEQPAEEFPKAFKTRWEEIRFIAGTSIVLTNLVGDKL